MPLTDSAIRNAKPSAKYSRLFGGGGLYLEVSPAGGKLWRFKYRFGGKEKRFALGAYPAISLAKARDRRDIARRLLAESIALALSDRPRRPRGLAWQRTHLRRWPASG